MFVHNIITGNQIFPKWLERVYITEQEQLSYKTNLLSWAW